MNSNLRKASHFEVQDWLIKELELTPYQKSKLYDKEIVRFSPFDFFKYKRKTKSLLWRFTLPIYPVIWVLLVISSPIVYLITGRWGYETRYIQWFRNWAYNLGL
ncbi:hypothetical protein A0256_23340 [Mucilaginibacter sp. PAMC 26640]|nr:hypothetical protein A0256_23340 [Mucilaginibacter sp. PAMC 26640]